MADGMSYELAAKLLQKKYCNIFSKEDKTSIKESLIILLTLALILCNQNLCSSLRTISLLEIF